MADAELFEALVAGLSRPLPLFTAENAALVASQSGIHPAYMWPEALLTHDRFATIAWLGQIGRCRRALIPPEVATTLADIIVPSGAVSLEIKDDIIGTMMPDPQFVKRLHLAIRRGGDGSLTHGLEVAVPRRRRHLPKWWRPW